MKPGDRVRVTRGAFEGWHGPIVPNDQNEPGPGWMRVKLANGETRGFPNDWLEPEDAPVVVRRTEAFVQYIKLRCPKCGTMRDNPRATLQDERGNFRNLVNAIGESTCDACRPKAASVPLLEYLDKLEATARAAVDGRWSRNSDQILSNLGPSTPMYDGRLIAESCERSNAEHIVATQPRATLALIAKLRELARFAEAYWPHIFGEDAPLTIEVPS